MHATNGLKRGPPNIPIRGLPQNLRFGRFLSEFRGRPQKWLILPLVLPLWPIFVQRLPKLSILPGFFIFVKKSFNVFKHQCYSIQLYAKVASINIINYLLCVCTFSIEKHNTYACTIT